MHTARNRASLYFKLLQLLVRINLYLYKTGISMIRRNFSVNFALFSNKFSYNTRKKRSRMRKEADVFISIPLSRAIHNHRFMTDLSSPLVQ